MHLYFISESLVLAYNTTLRGLMDKHAPLVTKEVIVRLNMPWFTDSIMAAKHLWRQAEWQWYSSKLTIHLDIYKDACQNVDRICRAAKSAYYQAQIEQHVDNPKASFKITDSMNKTSHKITQTQWHPQGTGKQFCFLFCHADNNGSIGTSYRSRGPENHLVG